MITGMTQHEVGTAEAALLIRSQTAAKVITRLKVSPVRTPAEATCEQSHHAAIRLICSLA